MAGANKAGMVWTGQEPPWRGSFSNPMRGVPGDNAHMRTLRAVPAVVPRLRCGQVARWQAHINFSLRRRLNIVGVDVDGDEVVDVDADLERVAAD